MPKPMAMRKHGQCDGGSLLALDRTPLTEQCVDSDRSAPDDEQVHRGAEQVHLLEDRLEGEWHHRDRAEQRETDRRGTRPRAERQREANDHFRSQQDPPFAIRRDPQRGHEQHPKERCPHQRRADAHAERKRAHSCETLERGEDVWLTDAMRDRERDRHCEECDREGDEDRWRQEQRVVGRIPRWVDEPFDVTERRAVHQLRRRKRRA